MKELWKRWVELFEAEDDPAEPHYDPVHLAVVLIAAQVVVGALYWLLWTLFVYEGGIARKPGAANLTAAAVVFLVVGLLFQADRRELKRRHRK